MIVVDIFCRAAIRRTVGLAFLLFCFSFLSIKVGCVVQGLALLLFFLAILPLIACPALHPVSVVSPLNVSQFTLDLAGHPD